MLLLAAGCSLYAADVVGVGAKLNTWHHAALVYDSDNVHFYLNGERTTAKKDHGDMVSRATDVVIGQAGQGTSHEFFTGKIDEVKIFSRALAHREVLDIFRATPHGGGHCENQAKLSHCKTNVRKNHDGNFDYCDAKSAHGIDELGSAHKGLGKKWETSHIGTQGETCNLENALIADGKVASLGYKDGHLARWDGQYVSSCIELDFKQEYQASGIKFVAGASDEPICGAKGDRCVGKGCGTGGYFQVFASGAQRKGASDYTTFSYQGTAHTKNDKKGGANNGVTGELQYDEMSFKGGERAVQYVAICRGGAGGARDNVLLDWVSLRVSAGDYMATDHHCDPEPPPPPPPLGEAFVHDTYFFVNSYDGHSVDRIQSRWEDVHTSQTALARPVAKLTGSHFVPYPLPKHFEFDGKQHFTFDHPEAFDFKGDFTVTVMVKPPKKLAPFHMLLSRRPRKGGDYRSHHHIFIDTRSTWVGSWRKGSPVAVFWMGGKNKKGSVWAYTDIISVGDWVQLTFVVRDGKICGFVNGQRSGACSKSMLAANRQIGTGEALEIGGEDTYGNHPLWNLGE